MCDILLLRSAGGDWALTTSAKCLALEGVQAGQFPKDAESPGIPEAGPSAPNTDPGSAHPLGVESTGLSCPHQAPTAMGRFLGALVCE